MPTRKNKNITRIVNRVNKSSADFVNRLKDPNRLTIPDWEDSRYVATHKLGVGTDNNGQVFIFPYVQNINGKLIDFSNPNFGKWDGMDSAIERKDTVHVNSIQDGLDFTENYKKYYPKGKSFKCGGRRKAQLGLDIREGGIAIPIANNMFYIDGRKHAAGGVAIGPNNKNGVEVEGGEVVEMIDSNHPSVGRQFKAGGQKQTMRVFSSVPFLREVSPAELVLGGANPDAVFKAQEEFKDRNRINDDGTTYEVGGEKNISINNLPSSFRGRKIGNSYYQIGIPPSTNKIKSGVTGFKNYLKGLNDDLDEFGVTFTQVSKKVMPKPLRDSYAKIVNAIYKTNKIDKINTAANQIGTASMATDKKKFGGSMIYEINGNVRNGLSLRPKAEWGKGKDETRWRYKTDPENFVRGHYQITPYGRIDSDGESYIVVNGENVFNTFPNFMNEAIKYQANKRPQYYAEKRLPIAGSQSIAEKAGLARSGWSYSDSPTFDYVPNINISVPINYANAVGDNSKKSTSSTPRGEGNKTSKSKSSSQSTPTIQDTVNKITTDALKASKTPKIKIDESKMPSYNVSDLGSKETKEAKAKLNSSSTGGGTQSKDGRWIGQYKTTNVGDWIGLGSNLAGSVASYFMTKNTIDKMPEPLKPVMAQAAKLKTRYNVEPQLSEIRETEQMNRASVRRNTQSSNISLAREQRLVNEARGTKNTLYGQKENIETQLVNQDKLNRQSVMRDNIRTYNEYLNRLTATKTAKNQLKVSNINNLISGLTTSVNSAFGNIESRRATNNTLRAIAAANPNVDARLIGGFDYYIDPITKRKYNKNQQYVGTING